MKTKSVLPKGIEVVVFLFASFGGFFAKIAPPEEVRPGLVVGVASVASLCLLLLVSALAKGQPAGRYRRDWLLAAGVLLAVALGGSWLYARNLDRLTFAFPPEKREKAWVRGTEWTKEAQRVREELPGEESPGEVLDQFGGLAYREKVWTASSLQKARMTLAANYVVVIIGFAATIFCLTEGILGKK